MGLFDRLKGVKDKVSFMDGGVHNIPVEGSNASLTEVFDRFLDPLNSRQLTNCRDDNDLISLSMADAWTYAKDEYDVEGFVRGVVGNIFILLSTFNGERSKQLQNISVGQMNREFAVELANIRSGEGGVGDLKDVI